MKPIQPVRFDDHRAMLIAGVRRTHAFADTKQDIPAQWEAFIAISGAIGDIAAGTYGVICGADPVAEKLDYLAGVEVSSFEGLDESVGRVMVPAAHYAVFEHYGSVQGIGETWRQVFEEWLPASGIQPSQTPDFEFYGDDYDPVTNTGRVEIWLPVTKPR